jgi:hypothetical protein
MAAARIVKMRACEWGTPILKDSFQATLVDMRLRQVLRHVCQAESGQRRIQDLTRNR